MPLARAQQDTSSRFSESVIVVGDYTPVLDGVTDKVNMAPSAGMNITDDMVPVFTYDIKTRRMSSVTSTSGLKAAKVLGSPRRLYNNYMRLGIGHDMGSFMDFDQLLDLYYTSTRKETMTYGARLSYDNDVTTLYNPLVVDEDGRSCGRDRKALTRMEAFGNYIIDKKHLVSADISFDRQYGRYYGFTDSLLAAVLGCSRDDIAFSQYDFAYNNIALNLGAKSLYGDEGMLGYQVNAGLSDLWHKASFNQLKFDFDGEAHYAFPMLRKYKAIAYMHIFSDTYGQRYHLPGTADEPLLGYDTAAAATLFAADDTVAHRAGRHLFNINPYVDFLLDGFKVHAGFTIGFNAYDDTGSTKHNLFPDISVSKTFANNRIGIVAGFKGGYLVNDWNVLRLYNPYIAPAPPTYATVDNMLYAHLRYDFTKYMFLNVGLDNHFTKNSVFFKLDEMYLLKNVFTPYYLDVNNLVLSADFTFVNDEMITLTAGASYNVEYGVPDNQILLYNPDFTAHLGARLNYHDKWLFNMQSFFVSRVVSEFTVDPVTNMATASTKLPAHFALSFEVEYLHSRALSFFAKLDNMTLQRYFLWANYPAERFNVMVGLTYTFPKL